MSVAEIINLAIAQGCEVRQPPWKVITPWGEWEVRYLYNPSNGGRFDISDLNDDDAVGPSTVEAAERRLGITLVTPSSRH
jgi:hypothetical protein